MGQSKLSKIKACQVAKSMGLVDYEEQYFYQLVVLGNAENSKVQRAALLEMQRIALEHQVRVVDKEAFALAVFSAAAESGRSVRILDRLNQGPDHPVNIYHPEGEYLKGLLLYVE